MVYGGMVEVRDFNFHDAGIDDIAVEGSSITLKISDARMGGHPINLSLTFGNISEIHSSNADGTYTEISPSSFNMKEEDGEILTLEIKEGEAFLIAQWTCFEPRRWSTTANRIKYDYISINM